MSATSTRPRSVVQWNRDLATNSRRVYGYEPYCACGWVGKVWKTHHESQLERSFHRCTDGEHG
jgi:hypothetical protein